MKSWFKLILLQVAIVLSLFHFQGVHKRMPASLISSGAKSCFEMISSFKNNMKNSRDFDQNVYTSALNSYKQSEVDTAKTEFTSLEDYSAWIDNYISNEEISLGDYFSKAHRGYIFENFIIKRSMPGKLGSFLFNDLYEEILRRSVKVDVEGITRVRAFKRIYAQKLADEALRKMSANPTGKFSRFMNHKFTKGFFDIVAWIPPFFGLPPMKFPNFILKNEKRLLAAKNMAEFKEIYQSLDTDELGALLDKKYYDAFTRYYSVAVAGFYTLYTFYEFYDTSKRKSFAVDLNDSVDQGLEDLEYLSELSNPSCASLDICMNEYEDEWSGKDEKAFEQAKADCFILYDIPNQCLD